MWHIRHQNGSTRFVQFGISTDIPVPGDYNGDGTTDIAVWRPSNGLWLLENVQGLPGGTQGDFNGNGTLDTQIQLGLSIDIPAQANYQGSPGDNKTKPAVWRSCSPPCSVPPLSQLIVERATIPGAAQADFNGNGTIDSLMQWGLAVDLPAAGDYDYGYADVAIWRPQGGYWLVEDATIFGAAQGDYNSNGRTDSQMQFGNSDDINIAGRQGP